MSGAVLGVLGGGQLGRMLAQAAAGLGVAVRVFDPSADACAGQVAELVVGGWDDRGALARFCAGLTAATIEFENVPMEAARFVADRVPLFPGVDAIGPAQDRIEERGVLGRVGFTTPWFAAVDDAASLEAALAGRRLPAILKSRRFGYDGKGQAWIREPADAARALGRAGAGGAMLDEAVSFDREISLLAVRGRDGTVGHYPPVENVHRGGILLTSRAPAAVPAEVLSSLRASVEGLLARTAYVGVIAVELFEAGGVFLANEYAPRVHNTGHWTIEGAATSQFENHVRAVLGMPPGPTDMNGHAGMVNLIGSTDAGERLSGRPGVHVHVYGKAALAGRKVGHVTVVASSARERDERTDAVAAAVGAS
jgi:5-(carboxyamino)imidazole ribonucleotide synthase